MDIIGQKTAHGQPWLLPEFRLVEITIKESYNRIAKDKLTLSFDGLLYKQKWAVLAQ
jgi:hypothetical protein